MQDKHSLIISWKFIKYSFQTLRELAQNEYIPPYDTRIPQFPSTDDNSEQSIYLRNIEALTVAINIIPTHLYVKNQSGIIGLYREIVSEFYRLVNYDLENVVDTFNLSSKSSLMWHTILLLTTKQDQSLGPFSVENTNYLYKLFMLFQLTTQKGLTHISEEIGMQFRTEFIYISKSDTNIKWDIPKIFDEDSMEQIFTDLAYQLGRKLALIYRL